jgi:hypothetical protein
MASGGGGGKGAAGKGTLTELLESPEIEDIKKRMLRSETDITTLRQVAKNVEVLQQEIVQVRQESIVSYKMMQNLQKQQAKFEEIIKQRKAVELNQENEAYKQLMQKFQVEIEKVRTDLVLF